MFHKKRYFQQLKKELNIIDWDSLAIKTMSSIPPKLDMDIIIALIYLKMEGTLVFHWDSAFYSYTFLGKILEKLHLIKPIYFDADRVMKYVKLTRLGWQYVEYALPCYWTSDIEQNVHECFQRYKKQQSYQKEHPIISKFKTWCYNVSHNHPKYYGFDRIGDHGIPIKYLDIHVDNYDGAHHSSWFEPLQIYRSNSDLTRWNVYQNLGSCHVNRLEFLGFMAKHGHIKLTSTIKDFILHHMFTY